MNLDPNLWDVSLIFFNKDLRIIIALSKKGEETEEKHHFNVKLD
jgi:hypothetical protein